jgi:hypothetical protein
MYEEVTLECWLEVVEFIASVCSQGYDNPRIGDGFNTVIIAQNDYCLPRVKTLQHRLSIQVLTILV